MSDPGPPPEAETRPLSPAAVEVLGLLAYTELAAYERLAAGDPLGHDLAERLLLARLSATRVENLRRIGDRLTAAGVEPADAMAIYQDAFDEFGAHTVPRDALEDLVKAHVGNGLARDLAAEIAEHAPDEIADLARLVATGSAEVGEVEEVGEVGETGGAAGTGIAERRLLAAVAADPPVAGRLALWARRLVGEALTQAHRVAADHAGLTAMITGADADVGADLAQLSAMFTRLVNRHNERMTAVGLHR